MGCQDRPSCVRRHFRTLTNARGLCIQITGGSRAWRDEHAQKKSITREIREENRTPRPERFQVRARKLVGLFDKTCTLNHRWAKPHEGQSGQEDFKRPSKYRGVSENSGVESTGPMGGGTIRKRQRQCGNGPRRLEGIVGHVRAFECRGLLGGVHTGGGDDASLH